MKFAAALAAALLLAFPARAEFVLGSVVERFLDANWTCESGQDHDGMEVDEQAIKEACVETIMLLGALRENGYCRGELINEWKPCE